MRKYKDFFYLFLLFKIIHVRVEKIDQPSHLSSCLCSYAKVKGYKDSRENGKK